MGSGLPEYYCHACEVLIEESAGPGNHELRAVHGVRIVGVRRVSAEVHERAVHRHHAGKVTDAASPGIAEYLSGSCTTKLDSGEPDAGDATRNKAKGQYSPPDSPFTRENTVVTAACEMGSWP